MIPHVDLHGSRSKSAVQVDKQQLEPFTTIPRYGSFEAHHSPPLARVVVDIQECFPTQFLRPRASYVLCSWNTPGVVEMGQVARKDPKGCGSGRAAGPFLFSHAAPRCQTGLPALLWTFGPSATQQLQHMGAAVLGRGATGKHCTTATGQRAGSSVEWRCLGNLQRYDHILFNIYQLDSASRSEEMGWTLHCHRSAMSSDWLSTVRPWALATLLWPVACSPYPWQLHHVELQWNELNQGLKP